MKSHVISTVNEAAGLSWPQQAKAGHLHHDHEADVLTLELKVCGSAPCLHDVKLQLLDRRESRCRRYVGRSVASRLTFSFIPPSL